MSEKLYACVLHILAPRFYCAYGEEATRLVRDRCRDEKGVVSKIRLWLDLLSDLVITAIRDGRFTPPLLFPPLAVAQPVKPIPSFTVVRGGLPRTASLLFGGAFSFGILATLSALLAQGGRSQGASPPSLGIVQFSAHTRAISPNSRINEQNRLMQAPLFGTPRFRIHEASGLLTLAEVALDANEKKRVIQGAITNLRESYVYPNVAREMIDALLTHERKGDYEKETDASNFAALLTKHLQEVSHDLHLRVVYSTAEVSPLGPPEADPNFRSRIERDNCAFRKVEVLPHNLGYVKLDAFGPVSMCRDTAAAAMQFLAHVNGLIFDLRENGGGDPHMVSFMASYLLSAAHT